MSNVLALFPIRREPRPAPSLPARVRVFSRIVAASFLLLAILFSALVVAVVGAMFLYRGDMLGLGPRGGWIGPGPMPAGFTPVGALPLREKLTYTLVALVREGPKLATLLNQAALFSLYARGQVFAPANARRLRDTGAWLVLDGVSPLFCHLVLAATGLEVDRRWAHLGSLQEGVLGLLLFVTAAVMTLGREIEEDSEGFV